MNDPHPIDPTLPELLGTVPPRRPSWWAHDGAYTPTPPPPRDPARLPPSWGDDELAYCPPIDDQQPLAA